MSLIAGQVWGTDLLSAATVSFSSWTTWQTDWNESDMNTDDLVVTFPATVPGALTIANENGGDPVLIGPSILSIDDWAYWFRGGAAAAAEGNGGIFDNTLKLVAFGDNQNVFQTNLHDNVDLSGIVDVQNAIFTDILPPGRYVGHVVRLGSRRAWAINESNHVQRFWQQRFRNRRRRNRDRQYGRSSDGFSYVYVGCHSRR